jgi:hypothetical protein
MSQTDAPTNLYFEHSSTTLGVEEIVMYNPRGEQDISSHALDLFQLSAEDIQRQRGYFAVLDLPQNGVAPLPLRLFQSLAAKIKRVQRRHSSARRVWIQP